VTAVRRAGALLVAALVLVAGAAVEARAAGYRYWSFWERADGHWTYATEGPSTARPEDGAVEGFRFAVSPDSASAVRPRGAADFGTICAGTPAKRGTKRVAFVLDFGTAADAPSGERPPRGRTACARVSGDATAAEALAAVAEPLRYDTNALLCAIAGYPAKGCGEQVAAGEDSGTNPSPTASHSSGGPSLGLPVGVGVVALLAGAGVWQARRRRRDAA